MHKHLVPFVAVLAVLVGCIEPPSAESESYSSQGQAVGEPDALGFPNPDEREMLVLTNQVRAAASNQCGDWTDLYGSEPRPPLAWNARGGHGARFTAQHLHDGQCFQHSSCCVLETKGDGSVGCKGDWISPCGNQCSETECVGGTSTADRYHLFDFASYSGENLAAGQPLAYSTICQWLHSDGHRENIYNGPHNELGTGFFVGPSCYRYYWVQGFGNGAGKLPRIPAASAIRTAQKPSTAESVYFAANYFDGETGAAPLRATVVVDGNCLDFEQLWGYEGNGTYEYHPTDEEIPPGCHRYYFLFVDGDAQRVTYPTTGTLGIAIGVDPATCPDYDPAPQAPASCEGGPRQCEDGEEEACYSGDEGTEGVGICRAGMRLCRNGFWSQCRRQIIPRPEVCNGQDDDCDGRVDNGIIAEGKACTTPGSVAEGICREGTNACIAGRMVCISQVDPEPIETCNNEDDDCDGVVDNAMGQTACGVGACHNLVQNCLVGREYVCEPLEASAEVCTTGGTSALAVDENCDGVYDEGCACNDGEVKACYSGAREELRGACRAGLMACEGGIWGPCQGEVRPSPEVCDSIDNDCDGRVDEPQDVGIEVCGVGACRNKAPVCVAGVQKACVPLPPSEEICNGVDDDCDGEVDEGCECQDRSMIECYDGSALEIGVGACQTGLRSCTGGAWSEVCDGQVLPTDEICGDGVDQNCDGEIDEGCEGAGGSGGDGAPNGDDSGGCGCSGGAGSSLFALLAPSLALMRRRKAKAT